MHAGICNLISWIVQQTGAPCTPFAYPEILATIPTLIIALLYMLFGLTASLLTFSLNPLCMKIRSQCVGRIENMWLTAVCVLISKDNKEE